MRSYVSLRLATHVLGRSIGRNHEPGAAALDGRSLTHGRKDVRNLARVSGST